MNERLERLEHKLAASERRLGQLQLAFALAIVAGLCVGCHVRPAVKAPFEVVDKDGRKLSLADLPGANLEDADLEDADLEDADLTDANLRGAKLGHANLRGGVRP